MSGASEASEASSAEQANEWAVWVDERMAQYSTRRFHNHSTYCAQVESDFELRHDSIEKRWLRFSKSELMTSLHLLNMLTLELFADVTQDKPEVERFESWQLRTHTAQRDNLDALISS